jgi:hypothetical protein
VGLWLPGARQAILGPPVPSGMADCNPHRLRSYRTVLYQLRPVGFQVNQHVVYPAHLGPSHLAQIPEHLVMDQHFPKVDDSDVAVFRPPELALGQGRRRFLSICFHF